MPSPGSGVLQEILVQEGETVPVGTLVARIGAGDAGRAAPADARRDPPPRASPSRSPPSPRRARA